MSYDERGHQRQQYSLADHDHAMSQGQRNRAIDEFVKNFNGWDWLYLRSKVRQAKIDGDHFASFDDLPVDILSLIAGYLDLPDVFHCQGVSRQWHALWTDPVVMRALLHRYYPGALQCVGQSTPPARLLAQLVRQQSRPVGQSWSVSHVSWNIGPEATSTQSRQGIVSKSSPSGMESCPPRFMFAVGKVAWQVVPSFIVIDDLVKGTWHRISFLSNRLHGIYSTLIGFSGLLLVVGHEDSALEDQGARSSCRKVVIYHVASGSQKAMALPNNLVKCFTYNETVVFVTRGPEAFVLKWGGPLKQLDLSVDEGSVIPRASTQRVSAVLFHPLEPEIMFLVSAFLAEDEALPSTMTPTGTRRNSMRRRGPRMHSMTITKYQQDQRMRQQIVPLSTRNSQLTGYPANQFGLYSICEGLVSPAMWQTATLMYSVVTESFYETTAFPHRPIMSERNEPNHQRIWNSYVLASDTEHIPRLEAPNYRLCLKAERCSPLGRVGTSGVIEPKPNTEVVWQDQINHVQSSSMRLLEFPRIFDVSDDFVVLSYEGGYIVLSAQTRTIYLKERGGNEDTP